MFLIQWIKQELEAVFVIIVGILMLGYGLTVGDFFAGIGDKLFKKDPNDLS